jgi:hypothetical protein
VRSSQIKSLSCSGYFYFSQINIYPVQCALLRLNPYPLQDILYFSQINIYLVQCALLRLYPYPVQDIFTFHRLIYILFSALFSD